MKEEKVFFEGEFGKVCGILHKVGGASEIVIVVHGFSSNKNTISAVLISKELNKIGKSSIRIDLDNQGESDLEFHKASVSKYVKQVETTLEYCEELGFKEISLVGGSFGGVVVMKVAGLHSNLKRIFLRCPGVGFYYKYLKEGKEKEYNQIKKDGYLYRDNIKFSFEFILDLEQYYPLSNMAKEIKMPVGIIHGNKDEIIDYKDTIEFSKYLKDVKLHIINGANHSLGVSGDFSIGQRVLIDFFKE